MSDEASAKAPIPPLAEIASATAPIIYFDIAPNFGFNNGIGRVTLEAITHVNDGGAVKTERRVVAHLRMTPNGLASLKNALRGIEFSASPAPEGPRN